MGVYIPGMKMPTEGTVLAIYKLNGKFYASVHGTELCPIFPVPPHGRLIDADAIGMNYFDIRLSDGMKIYTQRAIDNAPTVIPADEEDT